MVQNYLFGICYSEFAELAHRSFLDYYDNPKHVKLKPLIIEIIGPSEKISEQFGVIVADPKDVPDTIYFPCILLE